MTTRQRQSGAPTPSGPYAIVPGVTDSDNPMDLTPTNNLLRNASFSGLVQASALSATAFLVLAGFGYTVPAAPPAGNGYVLSSTMAGVLSWVPGGGGGGGGQLLSFGTHLTSGSLASYDGSIAGTIATDADPANTAGAIMARDGAGNFAASAATLTTLQTSGTVGVGIAPSAIFGVNVGGTLTGGTSQAGVNASMTFGSGTTVQGIAGSFTLRTAAAAFTMALGRGLYVPSPQLGVGSAVTTVVGIDIDNQVAAGVGTAYAIRTGTGLVLLQDAVTMTNGLTVTGTTNVATLIASGAGTFGGTVTSPLVVATQINNANQLNGFLATFSNVTIQGAVGGNAGVLLNMGSATTGAPSGLSLDGGISNEVNLDGNGFGFGDGYSGSPGAIGALTTLYNVHLYNPFLNGAASIGTSVALQIDNQTAGGSNYAIRTGTGLVLFGDAVTMSSTLSVGTVTGGPWHGTVIAGQYGGTGVANTGSTLTLGASVTFSGANTVTWTTTGTTTLTLPTTGTLITSTVTTLASLTSVGGAFAIAGAFTGATTGAFSDTMTSTIGTVTTNHPGWSGTATWNAAGVSFFGIDLQITNSASAAGSRPLRIRQGAGTLMDCDINGNMTAATFAAANGVTGGNAVTATTGNVTASNGNVVMSTAGKGIVLKSGSNARIGTGTLSGGTLTVANTSVTANTRVFLCDTTSGALTNVGSLTVVTTAGTGFVVSSTNVLDTSTFNWMLVESS